MLSPCRGTVTHNGPIVAPPEDEVAVWVTSSEAALIAPRAAVGVGLVVASESSTNEGATADDAILVATEEVTAEGA